MASKRNGIGRRIGGAIGGAFDAAVGGVGAASDLLVDVLRLPGLSSRTAQGQPSESVDGSVGDNRCVNTRGRSGSQTMRGSLDYLRGSDRADQKELKSTRGFAG